MTNNQQANEDSTHHQPHNAPEDQPDRGDHDSTGTSVPHFNRRRVLKSLAAGTLATGGLPGIGKAKEEATELADDFNYPTEKLTERGWTIANGDFETRNSFLISSFPDDTVTGSNIYHEQPSGTGEFVIEGIQNSGVNSMEVAVISDSTQVVATSGYAIRFEGQTSDTETTPKAAFVRLDNGDAVDLLTLTEDHASEPHTVRVVRDAENLAFTVSLDGNTVGTITDDTYTQSDFLTMRYSYETGSQKIDGLTVKRTLPNPSVSLTNARLVQSVEDTHISGVGPSNYDYQEPDPPLVAGKYTAPLFDLNVTDVSAFPDPVPVEITRKIGKPTKVVTKTDTFDIPRADIRLIQKGTDPRVIFDKNANAGGSSDNLPVFPVDQGPTTLNEVTITVAPNNSSIGDSVTLTRNTDFAPKQNQPLRVGFIAVQDPERGLNYGDSQNGETQKYKPTVRQAAKRLEQYYPTPDVRIYRHDTPIEGATDNSGNTIVGYTGNSPQSPAAWDIDGGEGRCVLEEQLPLKKGSTGIGTPSGKFQGRIEDFDATVLIVPAKQDGNPNYYYFHGIRAIGLHPANWLNPTKSQPQRATSAVEGGGIVNVGNAGNTVAQEVGHHLEIRPYEGPTYTNRQNHPLAKRPDYQNLYGVHAAPQFSNLPEVVSVGFDLRDGQFDLAPSSSGFTSAQLPEVRPFMSYEFDDPIWTDSRIFKETLKGKFNPTPPESAKGQQNRVSGFYCTVWFEPATGEINDTFCSNCRSGVYKPPVIDDWDVAVSVRNGADEELDSVRTSSGVAFIGRGGSHVEAENLIPLSIPFPSDAVAVELTVKGTTTRLDPISNLLRRAVVKLPTEAFVRNPEQRRRALLNKTEALKKQMLAESYTGAEQKLRNDIRGAIERWVNDEYETAANQRTKEELLELIDELVDHVQAAVDDRNKGGKNNGNGGDGNSNPTGRGN